MTRVAQLLLVLAAIGLWVASRLPWVVLRSFDGLGQPRTTTLSGGSWSTALIPFAVLLVVAAIAALAVRGWPLRVLSVLVALVSAGAAYLAISLWTTPDVAPRAAHIADVPVEWLVASSRQHWGAVITLAAAVATLLAAALLMRVAAKGSALAGKYAAPTRSRGAVVGDQAPAPSSERSMWDALDEGDDPTQAPTPDPTGDLGTEGR